MSDTEGPAAGSPARDSVTDAARGARVGRDAGLESASGSESESTSAPASGSRLADATAPAADRLDVDPALVAWALGAHPAVVRAVGVDAAAAAVAVLRSRGTAVECPCVVAAAAVGVRPTLVEDAVALFARRESAFRRP